MQKMPPTVVAMQYAGIVMVILITTATVSIFGYDEVRQIPVDTTVITLLSVVLGISASLLGVHIGNVQGTQSVASLAAEKDTTT